MTAHSSYDLLVFIGRFQPLHKAHIALLRSAADLARHVLVILGSADQPRSPKNPYTAAERGALLRRVWQDLALPATLGIAANPDSPDDDAAWVARIRAQVAAYAQAQGHIRPERIGLIGHNKDASCFYLDLFAPWPLITMAQQGPLSATDIRQVYFEIDSALEFLAAVVPPAVLAFMAAFRDTPEFTALQAQYKQQQGQQDRQGQPHRLGGM